MAEVSVLMPVYNGGKYLAEAIESIGSQSYTDWELIIVDDGSTDDTAKIISQYRDNRIYYLRNKQNIGLVATLNKGIEYCSGKYIARMDADDVANPERLSCQVAFMEAHSKYVMCGTNAIVIDTRGNQIGKIRNLKTNNYLQINLLFSTPFIHPSVMMRREVLFDNKYNRDFKHSEDYDLWCRISRAGKIANIGKELLKYRWHDTNISVVNSEFQNNQRLRIYRRELDQLGLNPTDEELWCHRITYSLYSFGKKQLLSVDKIDKIEVWFQKLIQQNKQHSVYNQYDFIAYVWSRWCVLCFSQKKYTKAFTPIFSSYKLVILIRLTNLLLQLIRK